MRLLLLTSVFLAAILVVTVEGAPGKGKGKGAKQIPKGRERLEELNQNVASKDVEDALAAEREVGGKRFPGLSRQEIRQMKNTAAKIRRAVAKKNGLPDPDAEAAESILSGDIVFNLDQLEEILESLEEPEDNQGKRRKRQFLLGREYPNGKVPYVFAGSTSSAARSAVNSAISRIEAETCVDFIPASASGRYIYVTSVQNDGCWSYVGRQYGRSQLNIGRGCESTGIAIHELMHAIGFFHEHNRKDRDSFVRIVFGNIQSNWVDQFQKSSADTSGQGTYDFSSIMHYGAYAASRNGQRTIVSLNPANQGRIDNPNRDDLSSLDILGIRAKYNCADTGETTTTTAMTTTTAQPPSGTGETTTTTGETTTTAGETTTTTGETTTTTGKTTTTTTTAMTTTTTTAQPPSRNCPVLLFYGRTTWRVSGGRYFKTYYFVDSPNSCCERCQSAGTRCAYWETRNYGSGRYRCRLFSYVYRVSSSRAYLVGRNPVFSDAQSDTGKDGQGREAGIEVGEGGEPVAEKSAKVKKGRKGKGRSKKDRKG